MTWRRRLALFRCRWRLRRLQWELDYADASDDAQWAEATRTALENARWGLYLLEHDL